MLLKRSVLDEIFAGRITLVFRRWKRPTVKAGGQLRTALGVLSIESVEAIDDGDVRPRDVTKSGYGSHDELFADLSRAGGQLYRIGVHPAGADPRIALRNQDSLTGDELSEMTTRLARMDSRSPSGPWTLDTLRAIADGPGTRAKDLAESAGMPTQKFKTNVRKLKELGLTISLETGYRISPRGMTVLAHCESEHG